MARIPLTGWFIRCPRWFYNRWPWAGIVHIWDEPTENIADTSTATTPPTPRTTEL
jgi:hypothetical protein